MLELEELFARVDGLLRSHGYRVERIEYPESPNRRSIDIVAVNSRGHTLLVKVARDVSDISQYELRELQSCSRVVGGHGVIVAERDGGVEIDPIAAHERMGMHVVSVEGLEAALSASIYVIKKQGSYYMSIDGEKLREKRLEKGYSLGDLASILSVSRRSVYMYEQEETMVSLPVALKLMEIFSEEIFRPFDILGVEAEEQPRQQKPARKPRSRLAGLIYDAGYDVAETRYAPPNALASSDDVKVVVVVEKRKERDLERRVEESEKVARSIEAIVVTVGGSALRQIASRYDTYTVSSLEEAVSLLKQFRDEREG